MTVQAIKSKAEFSALLESGKIFFVDFYADWCGPCKQISPVFERLAREHARDGVEFYKADIDTLSDLAGSLGIRSIPTFHAYKDGERIETVVGANVARLTNFVQTGINA